VALEGSLRIASGRMRLSVHAVDSKTGNTVFALDRLGASSASLLDTEAEIAQAVALRIRDQLSTQEQGLLNKSSTSNAEAHELVMRARTAKFETAEQMLNRAIQLDPGFAEAYGWLAFVQQSAYHQGQSGRETLRAAISNATQALSKDPGALIAMRALTHIQHSTGRELEGLLMARRALESNPDDLDAIAGAAEAYFRTGLHDRAIPLYEKAIAGEPDNPEFRRQLARIYLYVREYEKGMEALAPLPPGRAGGFAAILYAEAGRKDELMKAVRANPYGYFEGCALAIAGDSSGAKKLWTAAALRGEASLVKNENPYTRALLSMTYAKLGRREQALHHMRQSLSPEPHHPIFLFFSGQIYGLLGERQESLKSIRAAVQNGFFNLPMIDFVTRPMMGLAILRDDREFRVLRADLARRVDELRARN
jgi:tetratricopeptide (TPR) repeat protein